MCLHAACLPVGTRQAVSRARHCCCAAPSEELQMSKNAWGVGISPARTWAFAEPSWGWCLDPHAGAGRASCIILWPSCPNVVLGWWVQRTWKNKKWNSSPIDFPQDYKLLIKIFKCKNHGLSWSHCHQTWQSIKTLHNEAETMCFICPFALQPAERVFRSLRLKCYCIEPSLEQPHIQVIADLQVSQCLPGKRKKLQLLQHSIS